MIKKGPMKMLNSGGHKKGIPSRNKKNTIEMF